MTKMTYSEVKKIVNDLIDKRNFWAKMADTHRPFSYRWQECTDMATDYNDKVNKIFAECNPSYKTMYDLEAKRRA